jgi:hypothetical protein
VNAVGNNACGMIGKSWEEEEVKPWCMDKTKITKNCGAE